MNQSRWGASSFRGRVLGAPGAVAFVALALSLCCPSAGAAFSNPLRIAVEASGDLVVTDPELEVLFRVEPLTGDRSIASGLGVGAGPPFVSPVAVAVEASGDLVVTDNDLNAVVRVDPTTGDRATVSDPGTGAGPVLSNPLGIAVEVGGDLVVIDNSLDVVVRVDPSTGDRVIVSGSGTGAGPAFSAPTGIAVEASGDLVVVDHDLGVVRVDPVTGDRAIVSGSGTGAGPAFSVPHDIAVEATGDLVIVDHGFALDAVVRVDPVTGDRAIVSDDLTGTGPEFTSPFGIAVEASGDLVVVDASLDAVVRVDPVTGNRTSLALDCPAAPRPVCTTGFGKGKLKVVERRPFREKLSAKLLSGPEISQADFGDPTGAEVSAFALCLYDDADALAGTLVVDRALKDCAGKPCWKSTGGAPPDGKGYVYKDKEASASGVSKIVLKRGAAGKSKLLVAAGNNPSKSHSALPTGIAAALASTTSVQMQLISDDGACFGTTLTEISKQESDLFKAK